MKIVIVGGVAGGASAAARARRIAEDAEIIMIERGPDVSFANCGLPYYVSDTIADRNKLLVTTPERLNARFRLDVRTRSNVEAINRATKLIRIREYNTGRVYEETYDKLILSPGASPIKPNIPGVDLPGVYSLRNLTDVDKIKSRVDQQIQHAVLLGGGFINLELAENLVHRGVSTTIVERNDQVMTMFDREMTTPIRELLTAKRVQLVLSDEATAIEEQPHGVNVVLKSGKKLPAQMVILGIGVRPESQLAVEAGLAVGPRGGIQVNEYLQTSDPDIYAVGDVLEVTDVVSGGPAQIPLAGPANRQGRIAADNALGRAVPYRGTQGTAILGLFDRSIAMTGASEKALQRLNRPYRKVYIHPAHHAGYYPGAEGMSLKLLFDPQAGKILGAQAVGGAGVDKRIDVIAVSIQAGLTVFDLEEMELAYAPQFGSAKDPINMAGFVAAGLLRGEHPQLNLEDVLAMPAEQRPLLLDVRTAAEFAAGHLPGAVNISVDDLRNRLADLPRNRPIAAYCQVGQRGYIATRILKQHGFDVSNIGGGYKTYLLHHPK